MKKLAIGLVILAVAAGVYLFLHRRASPEGLYERYRQATVVVCVYQQSIPVSFGTGFFVSEDGLLLTNAHVFETALVVPGMSVDFELADGSQVRDYKVHGCRGPRLEDVCLLKLSTGKPNIYFAPEPYAAPVGSKAFVLGHPLGLFFSLTDGLVSGYRRRDRDVEYLQISSPNSTGNSGGPVYSEEGRLLGMATSYLTGEAQNLNFAISSTELSAYVASTVRAPLEPPAEVAETISKKFRDQALRLRERYITPFLTRLEAGLPLTDLPQLRWHRIRFSNEGVEALLPETFSQCRLGQRGDQELAVCSDGSAGTLEIARAPIRNLNLLSLNGRTLPAQPLPLVEDLMKQGKWTAFEAKLTPKQRKYLFSVPAPVQCDANQGAGFFAGAKARCTHSSYNDGDVDRSTYSVEFDVRDHHYTLMGKSPTGTLTRYYYQLPTLFEFSSRRL